MPTKVAGSNMPPYMLMTLQFLKITYVICVSIYECACRDRDGFLSEAERIQPLNTFNGLLYYFY
jgi:hypothetical protein